MKKRLLFAVRLLFGAALAVVGVRLVLWFTTPRSFPKLPAGAYLGTISGLQDGAPATFYLERYQASEIYLVIVFVEGFKPQAVLAQSSADGDAYAPLKLQSAGSSFVLTGRRHADGAAGKVSSGSNRVGRWDLEAVDAQEFAVPPGGIAELPDWLAAKAKYRQVRANLHSLEQELAQKSEKKSKLERLLQDEKELRARAEERKVTAAKELQTGIEERKDTARIVADLVSELDLLGRITKKGQAITLARRVAHRENKWYDVHWQVQEDVAGVEESLGEQAGVDFNKLDQAVRQAEEVQRLLHEREAEMGRIRLLEDQLQRGPEPAPEQQPQPREEEEQKKSLWDRVFG